MELPNAKQATDIAIAFCTSMKNIGVLTNYQGGFPYVPEVMAQGDDTIARTYELVKNSPDASMYENELALIWCAFMGMGAISAWNLDWGNLQKTNIVDYLSAKRGFDCVDEYVYDVIGLGTGTVEQKKLSTVLNMFAKKLLSSSFTLETSLLGMFYMGMVYEMTLLGMH